MSKLKLEGIFVPHVTPFKHNGEINEGALRELIQFWVQGGLSGLVPCGSNGEAPYLLREERKRVIEIVVDEVNGKVPVIAGTGAIGTKETIQLTRDAKDIGADAALIVTPFYFRHSNRELYAHYSAILEAVDIPVLVYNVPKFTGFSLEPSLVHKLASEYDNVIGVKDSSGSLSQIAELTRLVGERISVLAGTADVVLPTLMLGGKGAIIAVANVAPKLCSSLYKAFKEGNFEEASRLQRRISYINEVVVRKYNQLAAIKETLNIKGLPAGYPRKPTLPLEENEKDEIKEFLSKIEIF
ncbi:4-hydroxy-tetrahydrodipicolinate synthase [Candidatus Bathyarchaeota archaeon]|nr:MAG: 4-hydroxy-tetrahydrodipicolinate synthase [Candidatus Bathyarchaeota archaeon]